MAIPELVFPQKLVVERQTDTYGKFIAEPFERGYGHTLGNSLRRVLLSGLEGSAITSVKIKNVGHEYDIIEDVKEDVLQITLNLKKVRLKMYSEGPETLRLQEKGEKIVRAGDFQPNSNVEIVNPDTVIATLEPNGVLEMEMEVKHGRGYVSAEENKRADHPVNTIPLDALFSPVVKVNYEVENARVGQKTDYDRLIIELQTDGTVVPSDVLAYAAKIVKNSLDILITTEKKEEKTVSTIEVIQEEKLKELLGQPIEILSLSSRPFNCLKNARVKTIRDLVGKREEEIVSLRNLGKSSITEIKQKLSEHSLNLGMVQQ